MSVTSGLQKNPEFWALAEIRGPNDCWPWLGKKQFGREYGRFGTWSAHRKAFALAYGGLLEGECVCHSCDNPSCVNPNHLWLGTQADNLRDMWKKGRGKQTTRRGERCNKAKLTAEQAIEIFNSSESSRSLGARFGVSKTAILFIKRGQNWRHITNG